MSTVTYAIQVLGLYAFTRVIWYISKNVIVEHPLEALPGPPSQSFLQGDLSTIASTTEGLEFQEGLLLKYGTVTRISLPLGNKGLYLGDPKAMHQVFIKCQDIFEEPSFFWPSMEAMFGKGLLTARGEQHRKQRKILNPVFSINHMREMIPIFINVAAKLTESLSQLVNDGPKEIEISSWLTRAALELIGQSGFGYSFNGFNPDQKEHPYVTAMKELGPLLSATVWQQVFVVPFVRNWNLGGKRLQRFIMDHFATGNVAKLRDAVNLMHNTSVEIYEARKRALEAGGEYLANQIGGGKDILSVLMKNNMESPEEDKLSEDEMLGQISIFTFAGMDTTSSALNRLLYLLAEHQDVQDKLRSEILEAREQYGELDYDQLVGLPYLDAICRETLRLHPPLPMINRQAHQDAIIPLYAPVTDKNGEKINEIFVPKGTHLFMSILGCNHNPELWGPDANEWKPERWLTGIPDSVVEARIPGVYSHLMTFIGGHRACIGFKFSQLEMKMILFSLVERLKFRLSDKEIKWTSGITTPRVDMTKQHPELPLILERVA